MVEKLHIDFLLVSFQELYFLCDDLDLKFLRMTPFDHKSSLFLHFRFVCSCDGGKRLDNFEPEQIKERADLSLYFIHHFLQQNSSVGQFLVNLVVPGLVFVDAQLRER